MNSDPEATNAPVGEVLVKLLETKHKYGNKRMAELAEEAQKAAADTIGHFMDTEFLFGKNFEQE